MSIKKLRIEGLRSFLEKQEIDFAIPDMKNIGSGLTVIVGPNNSGKTTIIEALNLIRKNSDTIPVEMKNLKTNGNVSIEIIDEQDTSYKISTCEKDGAYAVRERNNIIQEYGYNESPLDMFILSNKRSFSSTFYSNSGNSERKYYGGNISNSFLREENNQNNNFGTRLRKAITNRTAFDAELRKVINPIPNWNIQSLNGNTLYLEFSVGDIKHSSIGAGDGFINIFNIIDAFYDASDNGIIIIDEPEISLHPDLQRKLLELIIEKSKTKQIVLCTHSPYFINWEMISKNSKLYRFKKQDTTTHIYEIKEDTRNDITKMLNEENPHILGLETNEVFFLNDNIILTEGQEDVICYRKIFEKYNFKPNASFFGWGVGGADGIEYTLKILNDLGYQKIFVILDNDKKAKIPELKSSYNNIEVCSIPTNDVRNKKKGILKNFQKTLNKLDIDETQKQTLIKKFEQVDYDAIISDFSKMEVNTNYEKDILELIEKIKKYFEIEINNKIIYNDKKSADSNNCYEEEQAEKIFEKYSFYKKINEYIEKKYKKYSFNQGVGGIISHKKIKNNKFLYILSETRGINEEFKITYNFHILVNIKNNKAKIIKIKRINRKLP